MLIKVVIVMIYDKKIMEIKRKLRMFLVLIEIGKWLSVLNIEVYLSKRDMLKKNYCIILEYFLF